MQYRYSVIESPHYYKVSRYFKAIVENINPLVHWYISFHIYDQLASHRRAMEDLGVPSAQIHLLKFEIYEWYAEVGTRVAT
jgi:hypothetical protein